MMLKIISLIRKQGLGFWIVLAIVVFYRLFRISSYIEFLGDQGRDVYIVRKLLVEGDLVFIGPQTSIGNMYLGPFYYYLMAPFLFLFNFNPVGPAVMVSILAIITAMLIYNFIARHFSKSAGFFAAVLFALSPTIVRYTSFSWNPNIMPFFSLLFLYSLYETFFYQNFRFLTLTSISFAMCMNSHYLALLLLPTFGCIWLFSIIIKKNFAVYKQKKFWSQVLIAIGIFGISLLPQIVFDLKHHGQNINAIIQFFSVRQTTINLKPYKSIPNMVPIFNQIVTSLLAAKYIVPGLIVSVFLVLSLFFVLKKYNHPSQLYIVAICWITIFVSVAVLGLYKQHIYDHYFGLLFVPFCIVFAISLDMFGRYISVLLFLIVATLMVTKSYFLSPPLNQLDSTIKVSRLISDKSSGEPFNLALLAKNNYDPPYRYFLEMWHTNIKKITDQKTNQLFVICEPSQADCQPEGDPFYDVAAFGPADTEEVWQVSGIQVFKLIPKPL